jgi:hypothetical protein
MSLLRERLTFSRLSVFCPHTIDDKPEELIYYGNPQGLAILGFCRLLQILITIPFWMAFKSARRFVAVRWIGATKN